MQDKEEFRGNIKKIQWNNRLLSALLSVHFLLSICVFSIFLIAPVLLGFAIFKPEMLFAENNTFLLKFGRIILKLFIFCILGALYFLHTRLGNIAAFFDAQKLKLPSNDPLYKIIENQCISRGLRVPDLYVLANYMNITSAAVVQDLRGKSSILFSQEALQLPMPLQEALAAQAIQRIHTKDTLFLTFLCYFGYFPYHIMDSLHEKDPRRVILKYPLLLTDRILAPIRNWIIDLRFARLDAGSLEITKEKVYTQDLLKSLSTLKEVEDYINEGYLPLFIAQTDDRYRLKTLRRA